MTTKSSITSWASSDGAFRRQASVFRNIISKGSGQFAPEKGRYHLYVSYACPWAHRTLIVRSLKGLEDCIGISVVDYLMGERGWKFSRPEETSGCIPDPFYNASYLSELYLKADPSYSGRFTVPVLWDTHKQTIVNNESAEIVRILNSEFNDLCRNPTLDLYPEPLRVEIDATNDWVYQLLNNGVYRAGFATVQAEYEKNAHQVHEGLLKAESILSKQKYLVGEQLTEADIRLFTTILRFDSVYFGHFKCNLLAVKDCPSILRWLRDLYNMPQIKSTINMTHIKINPNGIVPLSNGPDLEDPHQD